MTDTMIATPAVRPSCEARTGVAAGPYRFEPVDCRTLIGLRSFIDAMGKRRHFCGAPGHRDSVVARFGQAIYEGMD